jgi:putative FmdB family regulatory protein
MPIYEYQCQKCGQVFEVQQSFKDEPLKTCQAESCRGKVTKLFSPPAIIFKGSGFHVNDYGRGNGNGKKTASKDTESSACKTCDSAGACPKAE